MCVYVWYHHGWGWDQWQWRLYSEGVAAVSISIAHSLSPKHGTEKHAHHHRGVAALICSSPRQAYLKTYIYMVGPALR